MVGSQEWPMSQGSLNSSNRPSIRSPNGPLWFSNNPTKKFGKFDPMSASSLHMSWLWWGLDGMRLRLIEKLCTNFSLAPAQNTTPKYICNNTEHNTIAQIYQTKNTTPKYRCTKHRTHGAHITHAQSTTPKYTCTKHHGTYLTYGSAQHQSTDAPNTMVHTSHMEVHQAGGGSMALIKLNRLGLITEGGKFLNDPTFGTGPDQGLNFTQNFDKF